MNTAEPTAELSRPAAPALPRLTQSLPQGRFIAIWALVWGVIGSVVALMIYSVTDTDLGPALRVSLLFAEWIGFAALLSARIVFPRLTYLPGWVLLPFQIITLLSVSIFGTVVIMLTQPLYFASTFNGVALIVVINAALAVAVGIGLYTYDSMRRQIEQQFNALSRQELLERQMRVARDVQEHLLPGSPPPIPDLELCGRYIPAREVGGDYYDFVPLESGQLAVVIGDVSGKGVPAALIMAGLQASVRSHAIQVDDVGRTTARINDQLYRTSSASRYATFLFGLYDPDSGKLRFSNAGHHPPLLWRQGAFQAVTDQGGFPLGMFDGASYDESALQLQPGDLIALYTDGLVETPNEDGEEFGEERVAQLIDEHADQPLETIATRLFGSLQSWAGDVDAHDDATLVLMRRR